MAKRPMDIRIARTPRLPMRRYSLVSTISAWNAGGGSEKGRWSLTGSPQAPRASPERHPGDRGYYQVGTAKTAALRSRVWRDLPGFARARTRVRDAG